MRVTEAQCGVVRCCVWGGKRVEMRRRTTTSMIARGSTTCHSRGGSSPPETVFQDGTWQRIGVMRGGTSPSWKHSVGEAPCGRGCGGFSELGSCDGQLTGQTIASFFLGLCAIKCLVPAAASPVLPSEGLYLHLGGAHDWRDPFEVDTSGAEAVASPPRWSNRRAINGV